MLTEVAVIFLFILGVGLWLSAIFGFGIIAAPIIHRNLESDVAGKLAGRMVERAHLVGWYGGILCLFSIIIHSLYVSDGPAGSEFLLWSLPSILATSIWWVSWKKVAPEAESLRMALSITMSSDAENEGVAEAQKLFTKIHMMSVNMWKACSILIMVSLIGFSLLTT